MADDLDARVAELEADVDAIAEFLGRGRSNHTMSPDTNPMLAIAMKRRSAADPVEAEPDEPICGKLKDATKGEESDVCLQPASHVKKGIGHAYGPAPRHVEV